VVLTVGIDPPAPDAVVPAGYNVLHLAVTDTGEGIAPEDAAKLFRPYQQVHPPPSLLLRHLAIGPPSPTDIGH